MRRLVEFDLLPEGLPTPCEHIDISKGVRMFPSMAEENLRVHCKAHPGRFPEILRFARAVYASNNPGLTVREIDAEYGSAGCIVACTLVAE
jgi:hypothetical protein